MARRKGASSRGKRSKNKRKNRSRKKASVWLGGRGSLGVTSEQDGVLRDADWVLWVDQAAGVVGWTIVTSDDGEDCVGQALRTAVETPLEGAPRIPARVRVATQALADEVRATLGPGVMIEIAPTPELDEIAEIIAESMISDAVQRSYLEAEDVDAELVGSFFSSACQLAQVAPWNLLDVDCGIWLDIPELGVTDSIVAITGQMTQPPGFVIFPGDEAYLEFMDSESDEQAQDALAGQGDDAGLVVALIPSDELSDSMQQEIEEHAWPVPSDGLCPVVLRFEPGSGERLPNARDYRLAATVSEALSELRIEGDPSDGVADLPGPDAVVLEGVADNGLHVRLEIPELDPEEDLLPAPAPARAQRREGAHLSDKAYEAVMALGFLSPRARRTLAAATPAPQAGEWLIDAPADDLEHIAEILFAAARKRIGGGMVAYAAEILRSAANASRELRIDLERARPATSAGERGTLPKKSKPGSSGRRAKSNVSYQIKVTLKEIRPPIWRRIELRSDITLARLHDVIQSAMGWTDSHLHAFECAGARFGIPDPDFDFEEVVDERRVRLDELLQEPGEHLDYLYDFGDGWEHRVVLEKILPLGANEKAAKQKAPPWRCTGGRRACPPEDCGGPWGYADLLEALTNRRHPEHQAMKEWVGGSYEPERFDLPEP